MNLYFLYHIIGIQSDPLFIMHPCRCYGLTVAMASYNSVNVNWIVFYFDGIMLKKHFHGNIKACKNFAI